MFPEIKDLLFLEIIYLFGSNKRMERKDHWVETAAGRY